MELKWSKPIKYGGNGNYNWPNHDGVYVIAKKSDNKSKAIYVGQGNIRKNMQRHENIKEQNKCLREFMKQRNKDTEIYHAEINNDADRYNAEYTLFAWYGENNSLCNENIPQGKAIYTLNFPF